MIVVTGGGGSLAGAFDRMKSIDGMGDIVSLPREKLDITLASSIVSAIDRYRPTVIINTAAYNAVDNAEEVPGQAMLINATAAGLLARECAQRSIPFIHYSTDYVFDGISQQGYAEDDASNPLSVYGRSKRQGEQAVQEVGRSHPDWIYYIIRTSRLFGLKGTAPDTKRSFPDRIIDRVKSHEPVQVINEEVSSPTFVDDLARATVSMIVNRVPAGVYHRTNDGACTWYDYALGVVEWMEMHGQETVAVEAVSPSVFHRKAQRPLYSMLRSTKLSPLRSWKEALHEYLETTL